MTDGLPPDLDLGALDSRQLAAISARSAWLDKAAKRSRDAGFPVVKQIPPASGWDTLIWKAGRGFGKTIAETEWLWWEGQRVPGIVCHYVGPTLSDVKTVLFEGPAGLCAVVPAECLLGGTLERAYNKTSHTLTLANGSKFFGFSATEEAGRLRGPQCHAAACDELRQWDKPAGNLSDSFANVEFGCRLPYPDGTPSRIVAGTTPKSIPFLRNLYKRKGVLVVTGSTYENIANLSPAFRNRVLSYEGTKIGKQEIHGEDTDEEEDDSIFKRSWFKLWPANKKLPEFIFLLESYDTASTEHDYDLKRQQSDFTACVVFGVFNIAQCFTEAERKQYGLRGRYGALICDVWEDRLGLPELQEKARIQHRIKWGTPGRRSDIVLIENAGNGIGMRQQLAAWGVPTWKFNPGRQGKTERGHAMSPVVKNGLIFLPESTLAHRKGMPRDWCEPFLEQVCGFIVEGSTEFDDMYDAFVQGVHYLQARDLLRAEPEQQFLDPEEKRAHDEKEAERIHGRATSEQSMGNPYGE